MVSSEDSRSGTVINRVGQSHQHFGPTERGVDPAHGIPSCWQLCQNPILRERRARPAKQDFDGEAACITMRIK